MHVDLHTLCLCLLFAFKGTRPVAKSSIPGSYCLQCWNMTPEFRQPFLSFMWNHHTNTPPGSEWKGDMLYWNHHQIQDTNSRNEFKPSNCSLYCVDLVQHYNYIWCTPSRFNNWGKSDFFFIYFCFVNWTLFWWHRIHIRFSATYQQTIACENVSIF